MSGSKEGVGDNVTQGAGIGADSSLCSELWFGPWRAPTLTPDGLRLDSGALPTSREPDPGLPELTETGCSWSLRGLKKESVLDAPPRTRARGSCVSTSTRVS